jgi:hypothetical protein
MYEYLYIIYLYEKPQQKVRRERERYSSLSGKEGQEKMKAL